MKNQRRTIAVAIFLFLALVCAHELYAAGTKNFAAYSKKVDALYRQYLKYYERKQYVPAWKKLNAIFELLGDSFVADWRASHDIKPSHAEFEELLTQLKPHLPVQENDISTAQITRLSLEIDKQKQELADARGKLEVQIQALNREKEQLDEERKKFRQELAEKEPQLGQFQQGSQREQLTAECAALQKKLAEKEVQLKELPKGSQAAKRLVIECGVLKKELSAKQSRLDAVTKQTEKSLQQAAQIQQTLQPKNPSVDQTTAKIKSVEQEKDLAERTFALEKALMQEKLAAYEAQLKTLTQQVKQLDNQQSKAGAVKTARAAPLKKGGSLLARLSAKPKKGNSPLVVKFYGDKSYHSAGRIVSYIWDFDDGLTANEMNPEHTFLVYQPRSFNVTLTVKDEDGNTATDTTVITVLCARE
jgi:DNA repair exonuclease SbcCD ATPase subunit